MTRRASDDELWAVQGRYLGPPGKTLPWHARYSAYVLWVIFFLVLLVIRVQLQILGGGLGYVVIGLSATLATIATMRLVTPERTASALIAMALAELSAPRPSTGTERVYQAAPAHLLFSAERRPRKRGGR